MGTSQPPLAVRAIQNADFVGWHALWEGYNAFYGRQGQTALPAATTQTTWQRFLDPSEPVFALVAETNSEIVGLAHYLFHRSTTRVEPICYLRDLFTTASMRGCGVGNALIQDVFRAAKEAGASQVYWQTHQSNATARRLYDALAENEGFIVYSRNVK